MADDRNLLAEWDREIVWHAFTQMAEYEPLLLERAEGCLDGYVDLGRRSEVYLRHLFAKSRVVHRPSPARAANDAPAVDPVADPSHTALLPVAGLSVTLRLSVTLQLY